MTNDYAATLHAIAATGKIIDAILGPRQGPIEPKLSEGGRQTRTMTFRYEGVDFVVTYKIDVNGDTELCAIKSEGDLYEVLKQSVLDEADNQISRHAIDNPKF